MPEPDIRADAISTADGSIFDESYYEHDCGIPYEHNDHWTAFFGAIADRVVSDLHPRSSLDAGCAMGFLVEQLYIRGVDACGVDISEYAISQVPEAVADRCRVASLVEPIDGTYDLVTTIEVLEHMVPDDARKAIGNLCAVTDRVLFSSSPLDYSEATHVNVRPPEAWASDFAAHGFFRNLDYDATYLTPWAVLYERRSDDPGDIVRAYERVQTRMESEIRQLRENALRGAHERDVLGNTNEDVGARAELERQVEDLQGQLLAMRDAIVGLEVELGEALGQTAYYLALLAGKDAAAREYERVVSSKAYRATVKALSPYRRARGYIGR
jgi:hypothetical protein